jgi:hypothetical protein
LTQQNNNETKLLITPEMVEAGTSVLEESGRLIDGLNSGDDLLVRQVLEAVAQAWLNQYSTSRRESAQLDQ